MADWQRTHTCGELRDTHIGKEVVLNGWVHTTRGYNQQVFIDLRDRYGMTQIVAEADRGELTEVANRLGREFCVSVRGTVVARLAGKENPKLVTGKIEVKADEIRILNACPALPFPIDGFSSELANEELRMEKRYLDLRRKSLQDTLITRHRLCKTIRDHLDGLGFLEVETPLLGKSTPEGARDYLVPSREFPGEWYALPQSPQLYKQLLMVAGYDKYFQIARCLRDEDLRADRQPEFTQLDLEMSFVEMDDIFQVIEGLTVALFHNILKIDMPTPLRRISYADAMLNYGSDKPDLRFDLKIQELTDIAGTTEFKVFQDALASGGKVRALCVKGGSEKFTRKGLDELTEIAKRYKAKGLGWIRVEADKFTSPIEKFLPAGSQAAFRERLGASAGDLILIVADTEDVVSASLGALRSHLGLTLKLYTNWWDRIDEKTKQAVPPTAADFNIVWVTDFPSFLYDEEEKRYVANHHPFTAPMDAHIGLLDTDPMKVYAKAYDLVINGYECGGGSIRIHSPEVQSKVFAALGMSPESAQERFGFLLDALKYGAPPHGGIALGIDRWAMMLAGTTNIRDVIAFPKNQRARDLMTGAPASVEARQLKDLGIRQ